MHKIPAGSGLAIVFEEGPGYLLVANAGFGKHGNAMLVRSLAEPHELFIRKRVVQQQRLNGEDDYPDEVFHHRGSSHIPTLIDWTSYGRTSFSMTMQYCNGGTLRQLLFNLHTVSETIVPEIFIWQIFTQVLHTLEYLHHHQHPVAHGDIHLNNIFLHWLEREDLEDNRHQHDLPEVVLGDLGNAKTIWHSVTDASHRIWQTGGPSSQAATPPN